MIASEAPPDVQEAARVLARYLKVTAATEDATFWTLGAFITFLKTMHETGWSMEFTCTVEDGVPTACWYRAPNGPQTGGSVPRRIARALWGRLTRQIAPGTLPSARDGG